MNILHHARRRLVIKDSLLCGMFKRLPIKLFTIATKQRKHFKFYSNFAISIFKFMYCMINCDELIRMTIKLSYFSTMV